MPNDVPRKQRERFELLSTLYDEVDGRANGAADFAALSERLRPEVRPRAWDHAVYLDQEGLVKLGNLYLALTHPGMKEVERARLRPNQPTEHFEAGIVNFIFHGPVGAVQTGPGATAHIAQDFGLEHQAALLRALELVADALARTPLADQRTNREVVELVAECKDEVSKSSPNLTKVKSMVGGIAGAIRTVAALKAAYEAINAALALMGFPSLPSVP